MTAVLRAHTPHATRGCIQAHSACEKYDWVKSVVVPVVGFTRLLCVWPARENLPLPLLKKEECGGAGRVLGSGPALLQHVCMAKWKPGLVWALEVWALEVSGRSLGGLWEVSGRSLGGLGSHLHMTPSRLTIWILDQSLVCGWLVVRCFRMCIDRHCHLCNLVGTVDWESLYRKSGLCTDTDSTTRSQRTGMDSMRGSHQQLQNWPPPLPALEGTQGSEGGGGG